MDRRRVIFFLVLVLLPLGGLEMRLAWIQLIAADDYAGAPRWRRSLELVPAPRGRILDAKGRVLAFDERSFDLWLVLEEFDKDPRAVARFGIADLDGRLEKIYARIEPLMNLRPERERWRIYQRERRTPYLVHKGLTFEQAVEIETHLDAYPGCVVRETLRRVYPYGPAGALVVGTLGLPAVVRDRDGNVLRDEPKRLLVSAGFDDVLDEDAIRLLGQRGAFDEEMIGRTGVERACQDRMRGRPGLVIHERDPQTGERTQVELLPARAGEDVELTIDIDFQKDVESILAAMATRTTVVVLDVHTGQVRALANDQAFDPNHFIPPTDPATLKAYFAADGPRPLLNRATHCAFPFGSIAKIWISVAALEEGKTTPSRIIECRGQFIPDAQHTRCWTEKMQLPPHGPLTVEGALERSCNCYFYQLGQDLGLEPMSRWAARFGLGEKSGIELGDVAGVLPRPTAGRPWTASQSRYLAIGQGELTVTPVQVTRLIAAVANGGLLVRPHVVRGNASNEPLSIRPATIAAVQAGLRAVTHGEHGTAHASGLAKFGVSGKTSSAQTGRDPETGLDRKSHAWFAGYTKDVAIVVLVEFGGGGGLAAAPVVAKVLEKMK